MNREVVIHYYWLLLGAAWLMGSTTPKESWCSQQGFLEGSKYK